MSSKGRFSDLWLVLSILFLLAVGLISNFATSYADGTGLYYFQRQLFWIGLGTVLALGILSLPLRVFEMLAYLVYGLSVASLILVLVIGAKHKGATSWFQFGSIQLQPSEFAKIATLIALARLLSENQRDLDRAWLFLTACALALLPMGLILVQPDLGTALIFPVMLFVMLIWAGIAPKFLLLLAMPAVAVLTSWLLPLHIAILIVFVVVAFVTVRNIPWVAVLTGLYLAFGALTPMLWNKLEPHQQRRITTFLDPESDPLGAAYQLIQSKIAVGSGGVAGKGFLNGTQTQLQFLPEGHNDFIFSAFAEEWGFVGALFVVMAFFVLFYRGVAIATKCHAPFHSLIAIGVTGTIIFQTLTNLLMTVGFLPVTGLPLPLVSYGGSSMLVTLAMVGLLFSTALRWREY
ncbi:MAG: rod shape-determining protein RodA [Calditrichaeota bacterium]|nr:rod shape-determining protein RodA [Calditrichota bacterium]MCB9391622.1 rod shape-determining protein RodA [Calditrichota bacterium]